MLAVTVTWGELETEMTTLVFTRGGGKQGEREGGGGGLGEGAGGGGGPATNIRSLFFSLLGSSAGLQLNAGQLAHKFQLDPSTLYFKVTASRN
jgi:hypothetical protein